MSIARTGMPAGQPRRATRPPRAVVGSQINTEEQIFAAFDGRIMRRFWGFIRPYRRRLLLALLGVLVFAASQIAIPLILRAVAVRQLSRITGRAVALADVDFNVFTGRAALHRFRLAQRGSDAPALEIDRLGIRIALTSMVTRNVRVSELTVVAPRISRRTLLAISSGVTASIWPRAVMAVYSARLNRPFSPVSMKTLVSSPPTAAPAPSPWKVLPGTRRSACSGWQSKSRIGARRWVIGP